MTRTLRGSTTSTTPRLWSTSVGCPPLSWTAAWKRGRSSCPGSSCPHQMRRQAPCTCAQSAGKELVGLTSARLGAGELSLQLVNLVLQLGHGGLASTSSSVLSISKASLKLSKLVVQRLLGGGLGRGVVLL